MQLTKIQKLTGQIELLSGLHIGSGNTEIHIGGTDNPVIKNPINQQPYIPGSSIKGAMKRVLAAALGVRDDLVEAGYAPDWTHGEVAKQIAAFGWRVAADANPDEYGAVMKAELERFGAIVKAKGIERDN